MLIARACSPNILYIPFYIRRRSVQASGLAELARNLALQGTAQHFVCPAKLLGLEVLRELSDLGL